VQAQAKSAKEDSHAMKLSNRMAVTVAVVRDGTPGGYRGVDAGRLAAGTDCATQNTHVELKH
jgi:hypothetical protein